MSDSKPEPGNWSRVTNLAEPSAVVVKGQAIQEMAAHPEAGRWTRVTAPAPMMTPIALPRLAVYVTQPSGANHAVLDAKLTEFARLLDAIDRNLGGEGLRKDDSRSGALTTTQQRYTLKSHDVEGAAERMQLMAPLLVHMAAIAFGKGRVCVRVESTLDEQPPFLELAA